MKRIIVLVLALTTLLCVAVPAFAAERSSGIIVDGKTERATSYEIIVDGKSTRAMAVAEEGTVMVPMKAVAKALGYKISYNASERAYHLENGKRACDIFLNSSVYSVYSVGCIGMAAPADLGSKPLLISGTVHVPVKLFQALLGNGDKAVKIEGECLYINTKSHDDDREPDVKPGQYTIRVDGKKLKEKGYMKEGTVMVPLKSVARALGSRVSYNSSAKRYQLKGKLNVCSVEFGSSIYTMRSTNAIGMSAPTDLGSEPMRLNKVTYVPAELFRMLLGNAEGAVTISDKRIDIEK